MRRRRRSDRTNEPNGDGFLTEEKNAFIYVKPFITRCDGKQKFNGYKPYVCVLNKTESWVNPLRKYSNTYTESFEKAVEEALKYTLKKLI
jgi:hypothetical protein